jgi:hypothetical protein
MNGPEMTFTADGWPEPYSVVRSSPDEPAWKWLYSTFARTANNLVARYGCPLYLVGSALWLPDPGDIDIRCCVREADRERLFGRRTTEEPFDAWWTHPQDYRQWREELKRSRRLSRYFRCLIDFQFQTPEQWARYDGYWRLRLDNWTDADLAAGEGNG